MRELARTFNFLKMTLNEIKNKLKEKFPAIYCTGPIHTVALHGPNYNCYWIETNEIPEQHNVLGKGKTERKAWIAAWNKFNDPNFDQQQFEKESKEAAEQKKKDIDYQNRRKAIEELPVNTLFYWQSYGYVGNCINFWRRGSKGYTTKVSDAQIYTKAETLKQLDCRRDADRFYTVDDVTEASKLMVDHQDLTTQQKY